MDIFPTVATVAAEDPDIAANIAQPNIFTCNKLPGSLLSHGAKPLNKFSDKLVLNKISPIQTNNGNAAKVHDEVVPQIIVAIASPTGLVVKSIIPIVETPIMLNATQIPLPKKNRRIVIKNIVK